MYKLDYIQRNTNKYMEWAYNIATSPYTMQDKIEFAIISAHTPQAIAVAGWQQSRERELLG